MSFYRQDPNMALCLKDLIDRFEQEGRPNLHNNIAISWVKYNDSLPKQGSGFGAGWFENKLMYPASIVKIVYAVAIEKWIEKDLLIDSNEIRRALVSMITDSSNDATSFIIDLLTGTRSGPSLNKKEWQNWKRQRETINDWLKSLNWPELKNVNCCQKTWEDGPYGIEKDFYGPNNENRNCLSSIGTARLLESIMIDNSFLKSDARENLKKALLRKLDLMNRKLNPENQIDGFLGEGLPMNNLLWSKAGLMSEARHDAIWSSAPNGNPMLLVVFTEGKMLAKDRFLLPAIANELNNFN